MPAARGFTLVELLIVLLIFGLVVGLVGGVGVERLERARTQEEWLTVERLVRGLAFRAYAEGREVELRGDGAQLAWRPAGNGERVLDLKFWFASPPQEIRIDAHGIARPATLQLLRGSTSRTLRLNEWLEDERPMAIPGAGQAR